MDNQSFNNQPPIPTPLNTHQGNSLAPPQGQPQPHNSPSNTSPSSSNNTKATNTLLFTCLILVIGSIVLGIYGLIQSNNISERLSALEYDKLEITDEEFSEDTNDIISCTIPNSSSEIDSFNLAYNDEDNNYFVSSDNYIDYHIASTNSAGDSLYSDSHIKTDTSSIIQYLFDNGLNDFSSYVQPDSEDADTNWDWKAHIDVSDSSSCEASGNGQSPEWFNNLAQLINQKVSDN